MKMILQIFRKDARRISTNVVAVVVIMGLCILPCLYAWFNIISNWDPYGADATSNIKVAVYSEDKGIDISGIELNVGASVVSALESNTTIGWVFTQSASDGINGVYAGDYYAALIIPENFTENIISFAKGEVINPEIIYYENDKKNAIAPKITAKAKTAVQNQVNASEFAESPVYMETEKIYPIETYGSQMAAFYTILAIWFGSLILVAIIHVTVHEGDGITGVKPWQAYFGRYITFFLIGQVQALLTVLGNVYYIEIQCIHPFLYWFATSQCSFMFTIFIYSLTVAFGNVGEALAVIIMVIQVAGAGGTFPIEVLPKAYQLIYNYLPFKFGMTAIKETIGGMYRLDYLNSIMSLYAYVGISLIIGILVAIPFRRLNKMIEHSKEKTGFMI